MIQMFSTKGRYALRFMYDLATHEGWVSLKDISERQEISRKYLEQITPLLLEANLVESLRGKSGGYRLLRNPELYPIGEILRAAEGEVAAVACVSSCKSNTCPRSQSCPTMPIWKELDKITNDYLNSKTLADIMPEDLQ